MSNPLTDVQIANVALQRIGTKTQITAFAPVDGTVEATAIALVYGFCRDDVLTSFPWPWAQSSATLAQVSTVGQMATPQWAYSYRYPTNCLFARRVMPPNLPPLGGIPLTTATTIPQLGSQPWLRQDGDPYPWQFDIGSDAQGKLILTDLPNAVLIYTAAVTDPTQFAPDFIDLLAWRLALELAYSLALSDSRREYARKEYERATYRVRSRHLNEQQSDIPGITYQSEFVRARFGG